MQPNWSRQAIIRHATANDVVAINNIYNQGVMLGLATADQKPLELDYHRAWLRTRDENQTPVLVIETSGDVLGYASLNHYRYGRPAVAHVREISYFVHNDHKRQGVATSLYRACLAECARLGVTVLITFVIAENKPSVAFLIRQGFSEWGRFPGIVSYQGQTFDHLVMGRHLEDQSGTIL